SNHLLQLRRLLRRFLPLHHAVDRSPFTGREDGLATDLRAAPTQPAYQQRPPRHNHVHGQARQLTLQRLESTFLHSATRLQDSEENLDHPTSAVILNNQLNLVRRRDREARQQEPFDSHVTLGRVLLGNQHHVHRYVGQ